MTARLTPYEVGRYVDSERRLCALRIGGWLPQDLIDHRDDELRREREEAERIAYVAATRARDLLVVPAVGDEPYPEGWASPLNGAIYPADDSRRVQTAAPGCPLFTSKDSVLTRPDGDPATRLTVCPGLHTLGSPEQAYSVVWWAPSDLTLGVQPSFGVRREDLIVKDVAPAVLLEYRDRYDAWRMRRAQAVDAARRPSIQVMTATEAAALPGVGAYADAIEVSIESIAPEERGQGVPGHGGVERPGGVRFGTLVHALLSDVPLGGESAEPAGPNAALDRLAEVHGRVLGADAAEVAAARDVVARALAHPVLAAAARAAAAHACYRETPVTLRLDEGGLVEGHVDLAFDDGRTFVVVDFKTDREVEGALDRYRRQVQIYAAAIAQAMGRPARGVLMRI
jgi:ATP-dependent exoDNAse (exonuclease V) beta subunit